jgi:hypothetical protein
VKGRKKKRLSKAIVFNYNLYLICCLTREYLSISSHRAVRKHEADYEPMRNYLSIIACMQNISNTESIYLSAERIQECDEDIVKPTGKGFIKQYHHFTYVSAGVLKCQYIRGQGEYKQHTLKQHVGKNQLF